MNIGEILQKTNPAGIQPEMSKTEYKKLVDANAQLMDKIKDLQDEIERLKDELKTESEERDYYQAIVESWE